MVRLQIDIADIGRTRFGYSPLVELAESLYLLTTGRVPQVHRPWLRRVQPELRKVDLMLLQAVVPTRPFLADFFFDVPTSTTTSIDQQLDYLARLPGDVLQRDLDTLWHDTPMPTAARNIVTDRKCGRIRLAEALGKYWSIAIEPHWRSIRAVLEDDITYRTTELNKRGFDAMLNGLHSRIGMDDQMLRIDLRNAPKQELTAPGLLLMPSVFGCPSIAFRHGSDGSSRLMYAARGVSNLFKPSAHEPPEDALGALLGRSRATILTCLESALTTTELAMRLGHSKPSVSQHLSVLRQSGLVTSWRAGRNVMYRRTELATSVIDAHRSASAG